MLPLIALLLLPSFRALVIAPLPTCCMARPLSCAQLVEECPSPLDQLAIPRDPPCPDSVILRLCSRWLLRRQRTN
ncbi:hypothetical protein JB92DRAFT_2970014 [Gautieria morchelliformis]|nr:hypothetical protein JB92DRAFT_2970014 [Gautieria morchelliformis]